MKKTRPPQKRRGRPPTGIKTEAVLSRWPVTDLEAIDAWRRMQADIPPRTEAIRRLVRIALAQKGKRT